MGILPLWCRPCMEAMGLLGDKHIDKTVSPPANNSPSFEEVVRELIRSEIAEAIDAK
jgi:hypothetical protein